MAMGGKAPEAMAIMWTLTAVTWIIVLLRIYTRALIVRQFGADDYVFVLSGVSDRIGQDDFGGKS